MNPFLCGDALIAGRWIAPIDGASIPITNPSTGAQISTCPILSTEQVQEAIDSAQDSFSLWSAIPAPKRGEMLLRWHDLILEHLDDLAELVTLENGKPLAEAKGEVRYTASFVRWFGEEARRIYGAEIPSNHAHQRTKLAV